MNRKSLLVLLSMFLISSCDNFFSTNGESTGSRRVSIETNPLESISDVENVYIKVTAVNMDTIEVNTTQALYSMDIPKGTDRTIEVLLRLYDTREFYGSVTLDIDGETDSVEVVVSDITYGDVSVIMDYAAISEYDLGIGETILANYGDDIEVSIVRDQPNGVPTWFIGQHELQGVYTDSIIIPGGELLVGKYKIFCRFLSGTTYLIDSVQVTVEPPVTHPNPGLIIDLFEASPGLFKLIWSPSTDLDTDPDDLKVERRLQYKVVIDSDSSKLTNVTDADSPERTILAGWKNAGSSYYPLLDGNVTLDFIDSFAGVNYITILVRDRFGNISLYPVISADFGV